MQRGLSTEGTLRLKIDWASLIVGSKFTIFALFYIVFEGSMLWLSFIGGLSSNSRLCLSASPPSKTFKIQ